jgi:phenylpropionate dioxygenase-like ring-hydroxylating dioxygenase large terminal subunit
MTLAYRNEEFLHMVDPVKATVDRKMFYDQDIYQLEMERIFARSWLFMCHDSQIPNPGDFFMTFMGEDRVIVVRDNEGNANVLVNSCRHRGNAVCRAEEGHATSFMCTYHGWTYDLKGNLVGVPGFKEVYHEELDRENWGLITAAKVGTYHGFIFANMDPEAPDLDDYLGEVGRISLDMLGQRGENMVMIPGVQKYILPCNWKFSVDNVWDWYHANVAHASAFQSGYGRPVRGTKGGAAMPEKKEPPINRLAWKQVVALGEYGHAISGPWYSKENPGQMAVIDESWREKPRSQELLGPVGLKSRGHPNIFPTMWITGNQISLRHPKGPSHTEIWWFTLIDKHQESETRQLIAARASHTFGPAGMLEQEDGENWGESTKAARGTIIQRYPLHFAMNNGLAQVINEEGAPPHAETSVNEHAQIWLYRAWSEWMAADSWADLKANHSSVPRETM